MRIIAMTQKGINKKENEDRIVVGRSIIANGSFETDMIEGILAVADGVGGNKSGAIASHFVANRLCFLNTVAVEQMQIINNELIQQSKSDWQLNGMATTLSGIFVSANKPQLFSVGNTRVYLLQSGKYLKQLTNDDTTLNYLLATGQLSTAEIDSFDRKNEITACFGGGDPNYLKIKVVNLEPIIAPIMITSDGIHDYLSVDQMEDIIEKYGFCVQMCNEIISAARRNGSVDDASIILGGV